MQDFEEYLNLQSATFAQLYRCLPISLLKKENADDGNRGKLLINLLLIVSSQSIFFSN